MRKLNTGGLLGFITCALMLLGVCSMSFAATNGPGFGVVGRTVPTTLPPGGEGVLKLYVYNVGNVETSQATLTDVLPPGLVATNSESLEGEVSVSCEGSQTVTCELGSIPPARQAVIAIRISIEGGASGNAAQQVTVSGGGALNQLHTSLPVTFDANSPGPGINSLSV
ncbi:MAG: hypothetical protein ACRDJ3_10705, partial [Solirubrobacteraceae bacterium]